MASRRLWAVLVAGASTAIQAFAPAAPFALRTFAGSTTPKDSTAILRGQELIRHNDRTCAVTWRNGLYQSALHRVKRMVVLMDANIDGAETTRNAEELKTGVQLRSPDMDKLCSWVNEEITLWLDQEWIQRDVHREMGQQAAKSVKRMADSGDLGISSILFAVAEDLGAANFPRLFESDVNEWDVANKVSDLLLQSMDIAVCCTAEPLTGRPVYGDVGGAANLTSGTLTPESSLEKYIFMQKALDGRVSVQELNAAVLRTLGAEDLQRMGVTDGSSLDFFAGDLKAIEDLDEALQRKLEEDNKRDSDLDPLLEALCGEEMLAIERAAGNAEFVRRETCVKWLHVGGGY